jgi:hypothetical protein
MNSKQLAVLVGGFVLVSAGAIASIRFLTSEATASNLKATHGNQATAEALAQQIAQLNVEEVLQGERFMQDAPQMIHLRDQKSELEQRLTRLQPHGYQTSMAVATARAIEAQIADLEVQYAQDQTKFADHHPTLQLHQAQLEALHQRLAPLQ